MLEESARRFEDAVVAVRIIRARIDTMRRQKGEETTKKDPDRIKDNLFINEDEDQELAKLGEQQRLRSIKLPITTRGIVINLSQSCYISARYDTSYLL